MVVISLEFAHPETKAIPAKERLDFSTTRNVGDNWQILIGRTSDYSRTGEFWHRGALLVDEVTDAVPPICNVQTTTFVLGRALFHAISGPVHYLPNATAYERDLGIRRAWPLTEEWAMAPLYFTSEGIDRIGGVFWQSLGISGEPHFGMLHQRT